MNRKRVGILLFGTMLTVSVLIGCGRVDDVFDVDDHDFMELIGRKSFYKLTGRQLYFYGHCPECQRGIEN